jgi:hypothetical protein
MNETNGGFDAPTAAAELKIQLRPVGSLAASVKLPACEARSLLRVLMLTILLICAVAGPGITLLVGSACGAPWAVSVVIGMIELGMVALILCRESIRSPA